MTRTAPYVAEESADTLERLPGLADAQAMLLRALTVSCGVSGRATVDLAEIAMRMRMRDLTFRIALLGLRLAGKVQVEHESAGHATIRLSGGWG